MVDTIIEKKNFRKKSYTMENRGKTFAVVCYNSIGIPEFLGDFTNPQDAKIFFDSLTTGSSKIKAKTSQSNNQ